MKPLYWVLLASAGTISAVAYVAANPSFDTEVRILPQPAGADDQASDYNEMASPTFNGYPLLEGEANGLSNVAFLTAIQATLESGAEVIGVSVGINHRAYSVKALSRSPEHHVVNDLVGSKPITVAYCDLSGCARVLTSSEHTKALTVGVAGAVELPEGVEMLLVVNGTKVLQKSQNMPFDDMPFSKTTWHEWRSKHPDTLVYQGSPFEPDRLASKPAS